MNKIVRVLPLCFSVMFGFGLGRAAAQAQTATHQGPGGSVTMSKHGQSSRPSRRMGAKLKGEEYSSQMAAKSHCPTDTVVWVNKRGHIFHMPKSKYYGKTKYGAYACEKAATTAGYRAAKG